MQSKIALYVVIILVAGQWYLWGNTNEQPERHIYPFGSFLRKIEQKIKPQINQVTLHSKESFDSDSTIERKGILVRYPSAQANVVICHGFMCDKFDVGFLRQLFPAGKYNFLTFDFRAHGENIAGQCCTFGKDEANDVIAAANYFKQHTELGKLPTLVYAFSMGAVASIEAQSKDASLFKAMVLDCPFDSTENIVKKALQNIKFSLFGYEFNLPGRKYLEKYAFHPYVQSFIKVLLKTVPHIDAKNIKTYMYRFSPSVSITKIDVPCLFIHCKHDQRVAVDAIHTLYNGAQGYKRLWVTNGRGHYDSIFYNPEKYAKRVSAFFNKVLNGNIFKESREKIMEDEDHALNNTIPSGG